MRIKRGMDEESVKKFIAAPYRGEIYEGGIIRVLSAGGAYVAKVGDSYASVARRFSCDEAALRELNGNSPIYPTKKLWLP